MIETNPTPSQHSVDWTSNEVETKFNEKTQKIVDLSAKRFTDVSFNTFIKLLKNSEVNKVVLNKANLTEDQTNLVLTVINSNEKKGTKLVNQENGAFGPIYTDWTTYNHSKLNSHELGMHATTEKALSLFTTPPSLIIDFGAGTGQDTIPLLKKGFKVIAIDADAEALTTLKSHLLPDDLANLQCYTEPFINFKNEQKADLLIASFTWPYRPKEDFPACWQKTMDVIKPEGIIAGHFFGHRIKDDPAMTYHTEEELRKLLDKDFTILWFSVEPADSNRKVYAGNKEPAWGALFHVVAKRKAKG